MHIEELHDLYHSPNTIWVIKSRRMRWLGHVVCMGKRMGAYRVLMEKPEGKRSLGKPRQRWEDNIKMDFKVIVWDAWTGLMWLRIYTSGRLLWTW